MIRFILIFILLYLVFRTVGALLRPPQRPKVSEPPQDAKRIDENRIQDAVFKDLPEE